MTDLRDDRRHSERQKADQRTPAQRDRDRILYSLAFRRLAGVTQVVGPSEGHVFHNRLTHTLEVAQIARRLAEKLKSDNNGKEGLPVVDPDVVEAAALAHDLGHPPFGHVAEQELDRAARSADSDHDGFEGNAQSFRIITRLAPRDSGYPGLNLTRATLNSVLKYPWYRNKKDTSAKSHKKFGAYESDADDFNFARVGFERSNGQCIEAGIMDHADAIAYSVHDLADFYSAGLVPLGSLAAERNEFDVFFSEWMSSKKVQRETHEAEIQDYREGLRNLLESMIIGETYRGTYEHRAQLARTTSSLIKEFIFAAHLDLQEGNPTHVLAIDRTKQIEMLFLQGLVDRYVIHSSRLATQQHGQRAVIRRLFKTYLKAIRAIDVDLIPAQFHAELLRIGVSDRTPQEIRLAIDIVSSFTDYQAVLMHRRLLGISPGSIADILES
jgi:dGTPase